MTIFLTIAVVILSINCILLWKEVERLTKNDLVILDTVDKTFERKRAR
jgi:hypothetical protein